MEKHRCVLAAALAATLLAAAAHAEAPAIDHKTVGCVVVGKFPRFDACFTPTETLARARVNFRISDGPPDWYYVEMKPGEKAEKCHFGVLPKPKKELLGRRLRYYVNAVSRSFEESRTAESDVMVVASASECDKKAIVAPTAAGGAAAVVFPSVPAGMAAGGALLGGAATTAVVGGGIVVGGGTAVAVAASSSDSKAPPKALPAVSTTTTTTTLSSGGGTSTTTTTTTLAAFVPKFEVYLGSVLQTADNLALPAPATLRFDMCGSKGPYKMNFGVVVDGVVAKSSCASTITFDGPTGKLRARQANGVYDVLMTIGSEGPQNQPSASRHLTLTVGSDPCKGDGAGPAVSLVSPLSGQSQPPVTGPTVPPLHFEAMASDLPFGDNGVAAVEYRIDGGNLGTRTLGPFSSSPYAIDWSQDDIEAWSTGHCFTGLIQAWATDGCGNRGSSGVASVRFTNRYGGCSTGAAITKHGDRSCTLATTLSVPGGSGQIVIAGEASFPRAGRTTISVPRASSVRVEATLVSARAAGSWAFDLAGVPGLRAESVRVIAGDVAQSAGNALVFRMQGRAGERVVFEFQAEP